MAASVWQVKLKNKGGVFFQLWSLMDPQMRKAGAEKLCLVMNCDMKLNREIESKRLYIFVHI